MSPERYQRIRTVLERRQTDLTVCMENVHKPHNISAVMRTCDAVGIHDLHVVLDTKTPIRRGTTRGSHLWVKRHNHDTIDTALHTFEAQNMQVLVTHLSHDAVDFRDIDYTKPTAIILGQEKYGVSKKAIQSSHHRITIPMLGMVQSLNVSVAGALVLYEAQRQRELAGLYQHKMLPEKTIQDLLFERGYPALHKHCQNKSLPNPEISETGEVIADPRWWKEMQLTPEALAASDLAASDLVANDLENGSSDLNITDLNLTDLKIKD